MLYEVITDELKVVHLPPDQAKPPSTLFLMKMRTPQNHDIFLLRIVQEDRQNTQTMQDIDSKMEQLVIIGIIALSLSLLMLVLV